jgi:hypothetical protein
MSVSEGGSIYPSSMPGGAKARCKGTPFNSFAGGFFLCHDLGMVTLSAGDLGLQNDFGRNDPSDILQRWDGEGWQDYKQDGKTVRNPFDFKTLPPGRSRLRSGKPKK